MRNTLTESLEIVRPLLPPALFAPETMPRLWEAARQLVPIAPLRVGFECRLAADAAQVDLQQGFVADSGEPDTLAEHAATVIASAGSLAYPAWGSIHSFCSAWRDPASPLHGSVIEFWLEFDLPAKTPGPLAPSVFVGLDQKPSPASQAFAVAETALEILMPRPISPSLRGNLQRCFDACANGAVVSHLGVLLAREIDMLRVNVKHLPADEIISYLEQIGWPGSSEELAPLFVRLCSFVDAITIGLDIGAEISPRIGLECFFKQQLVRELRWAAFLDDLVARGLCTREKSDALLAWPGYTDPSSSLAPWPDALVAESLLQPPDRFSVLNRELTHVKITCQPKQAPEAKAYFGFQQAWLLPETDLGDQAGVQKAKMELPAKPERRAALSDSDRDKVTAAMELAVDFLLGARSGAGWWSEYDDCESEGPSDEWVTAYVGTTLAVLPNVKARRAARWAWALLSERLQPSGGWGWNNLLAPDADSTIWGLRLADAVGAAKSERARVARDFLARHVRPDGDVATYDDDSYRRFTGQSNIPAMIRGWFGAHACVTAAAAVLPGIGERARAFLRHAQREDGSWKGYWWFDDEYTTALAAEALASTGLREDQLRVQAAVGWVASRVAPDRAVPSGAHAEGSAFATAFCVRTLALAENQDQVRDLLTRAINWLLAQQRPDGSWPAAANLHVNLAENPEQSIIENRGIFTTATVISALHAAKAGLENP